MVENASKLVKFSEEQITKSKGLIHANIIRIPLRKRERRPLLSRMERDRRSQPTIAKGPDKDNTFPR